MSPLHLISISTCPHHSTETALILTLDSIYNSADLSKSTLLVSLDSNAAFDTIAHSILLKRLKISFGIDGPSLKLDLILLLK